MDNYANLKILFLSADSSNADRLRLGQELRDIQNILNLSMCQERFRLSHCMSAKPTDISQALLDSNPDFVHFSGHGLHTGELCFENSLGEIKPVECEVLTELFELFSEQTKCVLLNCCYSKIQAEAIAKHILYVIGMNQPISDQAAIAFATGFYKAIGAGHSVHKAFKFGCIEIRLEDLAEYQTPELFMREQLPMLKDNHPLEWVITLKGTLKSDNNHEAYAIFAKLCEILEDPLLELKKVKQGSIKLFLEGSKEDFEIFQELFESGRLKEVLGYDIESVQSSSQESQGLKPANYNKNQPTVGLFTIRVFAFCRPKLTPYLERLQQEFNINIQDLDENILRHIDDSFLQLSTAWNVIFLDLEFLEENTDLQRIIEEFLPTAAGINSYWVPFSIEKQPSEIVPKLTMPQLTQVQCNYLGEIGVFYNFAIKSIRNSRRYIRKQSRHFFLLYQLSPLVDQPFRVLFNLIGAISPVLTLVSSLLPFKLLTQILLLASLGGSGFPINQFVQKRDPKTTFTPLYPLKGQAFVVIVLDLICLYRFQNLVSLTTCIEVVLGSIIFYQLWVLYFKPVEKLELCSLICSRELDYVNKADYPGQESTDPWLQKNERVQDRALRKLKNLSRYGFTFPPNPWNWRHVFLSHRNNDLGTKITQLVYDSLKIRGLAIPFADFTDIKEGQFRKEISDALSRCGTFVSILTADTSEQQEWVERELNAAFYFYIQYGQPSIFIIEAGVSVTELSLDEKLLEMVEKKLIPVITIDSDEELSQQLFEKTVASRIEATLFRDYPIRLFNGFINDFLGILYLLLCLSFPFSLVYVLFFLFGNYDSNGLVRLLMFGFAVVNVFAVSGYMSIPEIFNRFTASRFALDEANPTLIGVGEMLAYLVLWTIGITIFLTAFWKDSLWTIALVSMLLGIVINLFSLLFIPTIWQGRKQYYFPAKEQEVSKLPRLMA